MSRSIGTLLAALLLAAAGSAPAVAEMLELAPRREPGESYELALRARTETETTALRSGPIAHEEDVLLDYTARVVVLETDPSGIPTRERHEDVQLRFVRERESGTAFAEGVGYEVERDRKGGVRIHVDGKRIDRAIEKRIAALLEDQFEYGLGPPLLDPGRAVEVGESWALDDGAARRFLRKRGIRVIELGGAATATLGRDAATDALVVRYTIPVAWWKPAKLPPNAISAASGGRVEGVVQLEDGRPVRHVAKLVMEAHGVVTASGYASPAPWRIETARHSDQRTQPLARPLAANF
jgi:hypothetical protein